jgi:hypothetical protein
MTKALIARHPLTMYYAPTFAISWGGFVLSAGGATPPKRRPR